MQEPTSEPGPAAGDDAGPGPAGSGTRRRRTALLAAAACALALIVAVPVILWVSSGSDDSGPNGSRSAGGNLLDAAGADSEALKGGRSARGAAASATARPGAAGGSAAPAATVTPQAGGEPSMQAPGSSPGGTGSEPGGSQSPAPAGAPAPTAPAAPAGTQARTTAPAPAPAPTSAPAATTKPNPYTATQVCGSGYSQIDRHSLGSATIYLLYNGSQNCVVTLKSGSGVGVAQAMGAWVQVEGSSTRQSDTGSFQYYAGPVYVTAPGKCVKWGGSYAGSTWTSGWEHCG